MTHEEFAEKHLQEIRYNIIDGRLYVLDDLDLSSIRVKALPNNMSVQGFVDIRGTGLRELPNGLEVLGNLYLWTTAIDRLPDDIIIGDDIKIHNKLYASEPTQLRLVGMNRHAINWFRNATESAVRLHNLSWRL